MTQERKIEKWTHRMLNTYTLRKEKKYWFLFQGQWSACLHSNRASYERKKLVPAVTIIKCCLDKLSHNENKLVCLVLYSSYPKISKYYPLYASAPACYIVSLENKREVELHGPALRNYKSHIVLTGHEVSRPRFSPSQHHPHLIPLASEYTIPVVFLGTLFSCAVINSFSFLT